MIGVSSMAVSLWDLVPSPLVGDQIVAQEITIALFPKFSLRRGLHRVVSSRRSLYQARRRAHSRHMCSIVRAIDPHITSYCKFIRRRKCSFFTDSVSYRCASACGSVSPGPAVIAFQRTKIWTIERRAIFHKAMNKQAAQGKWKDLKSWRS